MDPEIVFKELFYSLISTILVEEISLILAMYMYVAGTNPGKCHRDQMTPLLNHIWEAKQMIYWYGNIL